MKLRTYAPGNGTLAVVYTKRYSYSDILGKHSGETSGHDGITIEQVKAFRDENYPNYAVFQTGEFFYLIRKFERLGDNVLYDLVTSEAYKIVAGNNPNAPYISIVKVKDKTQVYNYSIALAVQFYLKYETWLLENWQ